MKEKTELPKGNESTLFIIFTLRGDSHYLKDVPYWSIKQRDHFERNLDCMFSHPWCLFPKTPQLNKQREVEIKTSSVFSTASRAVSEKGGTEAQFTIHNTQFELM